MSLIDQNSRFALNPTATYASRTRFPMAHKVTTSFNVGELIPFDVMEVLPGDTFDVETNFVSRLQTLVAPIMDDLYLDMWYFFVPNRIVLDTWKNVMGENTDSKWTPETMHSVPHIICDSTQFAPKSIADYMGLPPNTKCSVNALPFRMYVQIYNEWFRDQNVQDPWLLDTSSEVNHHLTAGDHDNPLYGGKPFKVNKYHDYFTSCLPDPQKGPDVTLPLGEHAPVYAADIHSLPAAKQSIHYQDADGKPIPSGYTLRTNTQSYGMLSNEKTGGTYVAARPDNLWAQLDEATAATINDLRKAFATQKLFELDARGGTRYREILRNHFQTISPDASQQIPELLSYRQVLVDVQQIVQQSADASSPLGSLAAMSQTTDSDGSFTKSFTEHGFVIGLMAARYKHTYQQGINRMWSRKDRFDYYWPVFANLGEQPVLNKELYAQGTHEDDQVFGYQEAWAEYRYQPDIVTSEMRSNYKTSLDIWHFADDYNSMPILNYEWMMEDKTNVDRALAVQSSVSNQIFCNIQIKNIATRVMPMYSIPGLSKTL